jgi:hypothetical protein
MGNSASSTKKSENQFNNFYEIVDYIATYYILTMDFKSLSKLSEKAYCDKLVILTSEIFERYFNDVDVTFLAQRIKNGVEVNELNTQKVKFINKDSLEDLDVSNDVQKSIRKKRLCIGIAKFYVKIAHVFAAIVMTINPVYTYKDATGQTVKTSLLEKDTIPKGVDRKLYKLNICDNRIRALKRGETISQDSGDVTIQPRVCDMNLKKDGTTKTLAEEPGIQELLRLYLDDKYDYSTGNFTGMTSETEKQFKKDLQLFYTAFTGEENMPDYIKKFSDIKLRNYSKKPGCQLPNNILNQKYTLNKKDKLFVNYANNIKTMIQRAADNQYKLLEIINVLFTYVNDPYTGKRVIRINPKINDSILQSAVVKTRKYIIDLYVKCEADYVTGVKLYEAIVESKIVETTQKQIMNLKKQASKIITETKKTSKPVEPPVVIAGPNTTTQLPSDVSSQSNNDTINKSTSNISESPEPNIDKNLLSNKHIIPSALDVSANLMNTNAAKGAVDASGNLISQSPVDIDSSANLMNPNAAKGAVDISGNLISQNPTTLDSSANLIIPKPSPLVINSSTVDASGNLQQIPNYNPNPTSKNDLVLSSNIQNNIQQI